MNRDEARAKVVDLLLGDDNPNNDFYQGMFVQYNYGEMTPISPVKMGCVNSCHNVVITEDAYRALLKIKDVTIRTNEEVAYFMFGEEKPNGTVWLDTVISTYQPSSRTETSFDKINDSLNDFVKTIESSALDGCNKQVICHGHTHGTSFVSDNFSFGDLISYIEFANAHPLFKNRKIETIGMLMPPCGDFNFIMYENNPSYEGFYKFPNVYLRYNNGDGELLPAYGDGNYIRNVQNFGSR